MPLPDYQSLMFPLLKIAKDGSEHLLGETVDALARQFNLTEEERRAVLPSGLQSTFENRVGWARTYLKKAGLLESTGRGRFRITERGLKTLHEAKPEEINTKYLRRFPEFREFQDTTRAETGGVETEAAQETPEEILESSYQRLRAELASEVLEKLKGCAPKFFEKVVVDLLVAMGYGGSRRDAGQAVGQSGDGGVDGTIKEDRLGLDVIYVQAKRWEGSVGRPVVQAFAGSLEGLRARKGVLITTSSFTKDAADYVSKIEKKIVLIDGDQLAQSMIEYGIGVSELATYSVKRIDLDYFGEGE